MRNYLMTVRGTGKSRVPLLLATVAAHVAAFDNKGGWKLDADGKLHMQDGNPVYINADGAELVTEAGTIGRLNGEAKQHRTRAENAEAQLKKYEVGGKLIDPDTAVKAVDTVGKLSAKQLIDADEAGAELNRVREEIKGQFTTQLTEAQQGIAERDQKISDMMIDAVFTGSEFVREQIAVPSDMFQATFRRNFKYENGEVVAYGKDGNRLLSATKNGQYADPGEALQLLVGQHPQKDTILKAAQPGGTGGGGAGGNRGGGRNIRRADFEAASPQDQSAWGQAVAKGEAAIVD